MSNRRAFLLGAAAATATLAATARAGAPPARSRYLYAVNQSRANRGSISVYDIHHGHRLVKTIRTVDNVKDVKGVAASSVTGRLYVAYRTFSGTPGPSASTRFPAYICCLDLSDDRVLWNKIIRPDVDRLVVSPDGRLLYVPSGESNSFLFMNIVDAATGDIVKQANCPKASHDALFPLSGPLFMETKALDASGWYLYMIDPTSYAVSRLGPYANTLGPYAVNGKTTYVVNSVVNLWGMQVAEIKTNRIITAPLPGLPPKPRFLPHALGWRPDEKEVWQSGDANDPHLYVWDMIDPMRPVMKRRLNLRFEGGSHWLTFDIDGHYCYAAPEKNKFAYSEQPTEIFDARTHVSLGTIGSSEDMLEIDFAAGKVSRVGDQYGIGRVL